MNRQGVGIEEEDMQKRLNIGLVVAYLRFVFAATERR